MRDEFSCLEVAHLELPTRGGLMHAVGFFWLKSGTVASRRSHLRIEKSVHIGSRVTPRDVMGRDSTPLAGP